MAGTTAHGVSSASFAAAKEAFEAAHLESSRGAALAVSVHGEPVIDLWIGERGTGAPWEESTLCCGFSVAKAVTATALAILVDRGELALDEPVATYWPEFAAGGKEAITLRTVLTHQAGTNWFEGYEQIVTCDDPAGFENVPAITAAIAAAEPVWPPNTRVGYTSMTIGWIATELVRRVTGNPLATFVADEVAGPLGLTDLFFGVPADRLGAVVDLAPDAAWESEQILANINPDTPAGKNLFLNERTLGAAFRELWNDDRFRAAEQGAINLISTARDLARVFAVWAGRGAVGDVRLFSAATADEFMREQAATPQDAAVFSSQRLGLVLWRPHDGFRFGPNDEAVAHIGLGGAVGIADPVSGVSIAYLPGELRVPSIFATDERLVPVIDAVFQALDARG